MAEVDKAIEDGRELALRVVIEESPCAGTVNMARDEMLLEQADQFETATLRWYRWREPTLSLGYFQDDEPDELPDVPRVRRLSGGGAIFHDDEWTYSLAVPRCVASNAKALYAIVHEILVDAFRACGVTVAMRGVDRPEINGAFLCFERGDRHDIEVVDGPAAGAKVVGSAQRRRGRGILQHGSIALTTEVDAGHGPIRLGDLVDSEEFLSGVSVELSGRLGLRLVSESWSVREREFADDWAAEKYELLVWDRQRRRGPSSIPPANGFLVPRA